MKPLEAHFEFFSFLRPKSKIENNYLFTKTFALCLVPSYKMMNQNLKFVEKKLRTKHPIKWTDADTGPAAAFLACLPAMVARVP